LIKNEDESTYVVGSDVQSFLDLPQSIAINVWYLVGSEFTAYWSSTPDS
jgi:hypothetical protein